MAPDDPNAHNGELDGILSEMSGGSAQKSAAPAAPLGPASKSALAGEPNLSNIEDLLSEARTTPHEHSTTEEVKGGPAGAPAGNSGVAVARRAASGAAASGPGLPRTGLWLVCAILAVNTLGILGIGAAFMFFSGSQRNNAVAVVQALREMGTARQTAVPAEQADPKKEATARGEQALKMFDAGQFEQALPLLQGASAALPDRADLLWKTGCAAERLKQWRVALDAFQKFSQSFPRDDAFGQSLAHLAACYKQLGFYAMARKTHYRLIALSGRLPDDQQQMVREAYLEIADCYNREAGQDTAAPADEHTAAPADEHAAAPQTGARNDAAK